MTELLLKKILRMTRYAFFGIILQCATTSVLLSSNITLGQPKSLDEVYVTISMENVKITDVFLELEKSTGFNFAYNNKNIDQSVRITLSAANKSLTSILENISVQANLKFRRINGNIHVSHLENSDTSAVTDTENTSASESSESLVTSEKMQPVRLISGKITDATTHDALPGASVIIKGTTIGATTDANGDYSLEISDDNSVLIFSFIGYKPQEIIVGTQTSINVSLEADITSLNEVVVVGYGTQERKEITNAVTSVKAEDFNKGNITSVAQLLQGKVAGLSISKPGGDPNGTFSIRLRGLSTIGQNTSPLVVVDGVIGADINSVDPNDIATIDILKDGSAAAIYGTRGSAGVILITTKSGKDGKVNIDYSTFVSAEQMAKHNEVMNASEFRATRAADPTQLPNDFGASTDWYKAITRTAVSQVHNLSLSGGNPSTTYRASVNYRDVPGVAINTGFKQLNTRLNLTQKAFHDKVTFSLNLAQTSRKSDLGFPAAFSQASLYNPTAPIRVMPGDPLYDDLSSRGLVTADNDYYFQNINIGQHYNPVALLKQNSNQVDLQRTNTNIQAEWSILKNLKLLGHYATQRENSNQYVNISKKSLIDTRNVDGVVASGYSGTLNYIGNSQNGIASQRNFQTYNQLLESTLTYDANLAEGLKLNLMGGYSYQEFINQGFGVTGGNTISDAFTVDNFGTDLDFKNGLGDVSSYKNSSKLIAFFGRASLNFKDTYFLTASLRREGSTKFGANNKWGNFPAVSAGVDIVKLADLTVMDNLKVRASYGVTGAIPTDSYLSLFNFSPSGNGLSGGVFSPTYGPSLNANPNFKWERKSEFDIGLDFALLNSRLSGTFDYYNRKTTDLIWFAKVPQPPNQAPNTWLNLGDLRSKGLEIAMNYIAIDKGDFRWTTGFNYSTFNVKIVSLHNDTYTPGVLSLANIGAPNLNGFNAVLVKEGDQLGNLRGPKFTGLDDNGMYTVSKDTTILGNGIPKFTLGFVNTVKYRNWDLNFFFRGAFGHSLLNSGRIFQEYPKVSEQFNVVKTRYYNPNTSFDQTPSSYSSLFVEDASFIKLDNATLGYNVKLPSTNIFKRLRLYVTGQNLFVITKYTGIDPEPRYTDTEQTSAASILSPGIERRGDWVRTRSFTLGLNLGF